MTMGLDTSLHVNEGTAHHPVRRHATFYLLEAALLIAAGLFAMIFPVISSAAFVLILGWVLIISGVVQGIGLISGRAAPHFWSQLISVVLGILIGALLLRNVGQGMVVISLLLIVFFMMEGVSKIIFALTVRPLPNWVWVLASGVLGVVLSALLWASMPVTAFWLIGLMLGINLVAEGLSLGALAWHARRSA
ncbi:HdeD family acid-resistance protein [Rhodobacter sp. CZR27]|uniref:HdeD family acid-resistance protein n=1 Tax=Rhodobacter sp. CZR27 TaxID=2033869 RepID=UPI000BBE4D2D|nr:HdeD family acid-resistance protein [Rhodobacter sp. CZR27]